VAVVSDIGDRIEKRVGVRSDNQGVGYLSCPHFVGHSKAESVLPLFAMIRGGCKGWVGSGISISDSRFRPESQPPARFSERGRSPSEENRSGGAFQIGNGKNFI